MKKIMPIILCSIILFCTACDPSKSIDYLNLYDNITVNSSFDDIIAIHKDAKSISNDYEELQLYDCSNTILSEIAKKYNTKVDIYVSRSTDFIFDEEEHLTERENLNIIVDVESENINYDDYESINKILSKKYGNPLKTKEQTIVNDNVFTTQYNIENIVTVEYTENKSMNIMYQFR